ncbi:MAG: hypothetical protein AMK72_04155 [Planctomycetes bacterium SM23_25]|nr:MAG: hypothetical protein AMK72_04155 [Planctomycetes bacterium SM23_25]
MNVQWRERILAAALSCAALMAWSGRSARAAEPLSAAAVRTSAGRQVCLVTADGPLGLPAAYATGFVLGNGQFVVTDLASVARPGVAQVTLRFEDGKTAVCREFGMADPATGLVAIHVAEPRPGEAGLALSTAATVGEGGTPAVVIGWKWGQQLDLAMGRLTNGVPGVELAERLKIAAPQGPSRFLVLLSTGLEIAPGAPLIDGAGGVVGVLAGILGSGETLVVPAELLRAALLSAGAQLKPLSQLPQPVWPAVVQDLAGKPATPQEFAAAVRAVKTRSRCKTCNGSGTVVVRKLVGQNRVGGLSRPIYREETQTCSACQGECVVCGDGLYAHFARMAEGAVRLLASPATPEKAREAAITNGRALLDALGKVGPRYRDELVAQAQADLSASGTDLPRGVVVYAQLRGDLKGPDGPYTRVAPHRAATDLAIRADRFRQALGEDEGANDAGPVEGDWIILAGLAEGTVNLDGRQTVHLRPFGWAWGPSLGPRPATAPPARRTGHPGAEGLKKGEPSFFGL